MRTINPLVNFESRFQLKRIIHPISEPSASFFISVLFVLHAQYYIRR